MHIKTTFILLFVTYVIGVVLNSIKTNANNANFAAPYLILIFLFLCYAVLSILLTIKLYNTGTFQWISVHAGLLKLVLVIGLLSILYTVFTAMMIRADWSTYQNHSIAHPKDFLIFASYIWVPLLMLVPYALAAYNYDVALSESFFFKTPLIVNTIIGISFYVFMHMGSIKAMMSPRQSENEYYIQQTLDKIRNGQSIEDYLFYTLPENDLIIRDAAFTKLNENEKWANQLLQKLKSCDDLYTILTIHNFLSIYSFEYPEKLIEPFGKSLDCISKEITAYAANEYTFPTNLNGLNIEKILVAVEKQFVGQEHKLFEKLDIITEALKAIKREDYKQKTAELISKIEHFKDKFS